jgi:hypothetical protein
MGKRNEQAMVVIVARELGFPCRKTRVMVSVVPVDGAHVMLNGVPAVIEVRLVKVKGFCALVRAARAAKRRVRENCIFAIYSSFFFLLNSSLQFSSKAKSSRYTRIIITMYNVQYNDKQQRSASRSRINTKFIAQARSFVSRLPNLLLTHLYVQPPRLFRRDNEASGRSGASLAAESSATPFLQQPIATAEVKVLTSPLRNRTPDSDPVRGKESYPRKISEKFLFIYTLSPQSHKHAAHAHKKRRYKYWIQKPRRHRLHSSHHSPINNKKNKFFTPADCSSFSLWSLDK